MNVRRQVLVQLTEDLLAAVDECASRRGVSRSELVRSALREHLAGDTKAQADRRIVEGYARVPQPEHDPWPDLSVLESIREEPW